MVTEKFEAYDGGIYSEENSDPEINHELSIVGWGFDEATGYNFDKNFVLKFLVCHLVSISPTF